MINSFFLFLNLTISNVFIAICVWTASAILGIKVNLVEVFLVLEFLLASVMLLLLFLPSAEEH